MSSHHSLIASVGELFAAVAQPQAIQSMNGYTEELILKNQQHMVFAEYRT